MTEKRRCDKDFRARSYSRLTPHASRLTPHASRLTPHASRLTPHASRSVYSSRVTSTKRALFQIHFCVLLWGFTAILGKLISLPALPLVWWRMSLVAVAALCLPAVWRGLRELTPRLLMIYAGIGVLVGVHWLTFYGSIKLSNASIAVTCMALSPVFLSLVDPWIGGRRFDWHEVLFGLAVIPGVALIVGGTPTQMRLGLISGVFSALIVAFFSSLNKRFVNRGAPLAVTCIEMAAGAIAIAAVAPLFVDAQQMFAVPSARDSGLLIVLALGCTLLPFSLSLIALRVLPVFTAQLIINLEPIYAIVLAMLLFGEQRELTLSFYLGVVIVVGAVFAHPWFSARRPRSGHRTADRET
jgi:drug/metabolite transporter (DMT)-like permease